MSKSLTWMWMSKILTLRSTKYWKKINLTTDWKKIDFWTISTSFIEYCGVQTYLNKKFVRSDLSTESIPSKGGSTHFALIIDWDRKLCKHDDVLSLLRVRLLQKTVFHDFYLCFLFSNHYPLEVVLMLAESLKLVDLGFVVSDLFLGVWVLRTFVLGSFAARLD